VAQGRAQGARTRRREAGRPHRRVWLEQRDRVGERRHRSVKHDAAR
jgi:hypothetical protein